MIVYDAGVLVGAERGDHRVRARHTALLERGVIPVIPVAVLAQAWRGGPQPNLSRLLRGCDVVGLDEVGARRAGELCARAGSADVVDASVVDAAAQRDAPVLTFDVADLRPLAQVAEPVVRIEPM